ncbi:sodium, potassium, lithium and rubidium/H(+) antiporter [Variibacter gotjawalensis]|uniref:Sodium, potassium, lithium and rubidium/H(+) antiporter n=1 Tax=Variibacter gotjawalensis TaxID=1333996 RepID=A0A0S3PTS7_9BRAD|nr:Na+/H+ antiporter [Variibacter gotjawalensis]NIK49687.1 CPA1 family monovalent cation:H+ antiporter [Variibacter gotjawalensis]RZS45699.1 sodium/proton antiporter (CPA1 family) [Variibacter gotjawalensis]BAT59370.1 sodium, potassium, lithium and rubidium/H(+) antiporter [Variibacter gotjawalensis]
MHTAELVLQLLFAVAVSGLLVRLTRIPAPFVQIALGAALAWPQLGGIHVMLDPELFLLLFIPPLLFIDGLNAPKRELRELWLPIGSLAFGLVFFTIAVVGPLLHWLIPALPLPVAYALAAVLSPTDAVAVSSLIDRAKMPPRLMHLLEGEALLNDASGLVVFRFAIAAALTGTFVLKSTYGPFVLVAAGGALAGLVTLVVLAQAQRFLAKLGDIAPEVQVLVNLLLPFAAYIVAEQFHASGIIAAVTAGLLFRWSGMYKHIGLAAGIQSNIVSGTIAFVFNGMVFLLLGLQLPDIIRKVPPEIASRHAWLEPLAVIVALTIGLLIVRFVFVMGNAKIRYIAVRLRGRVASRMPLFAAFALSIGGVRGAVTLAGVMSIPLLLPNGAPFPGRDLAIFLAAGVIICSLVIAALVLPFITSKLTLPSDNPLETEERAARIAAASAAIATIQERAGGLAASEELATAAAERLIASYRLRIAAAEDGNAQQDEARTLSRLEDDLRLAAIASERLAVRELFVKRKIGDETVNRLMSDLAMTEATLRKFRGANTKA